MVTEERLAEIRARLEATTPGPWQEPAEDDPGMAVWTIADSCAGGGICVPEDYYPRGDNHPRENMLFIGHAWEDVRDLLDEVERLQRIVNEPKEE